MTDKLFAARVLSLLDLTELSDGAREDNVEVLIRKALGPWGKPAAVCIWPQFVSLAAGRLKGKGVAVATVVNFPKGGDDVERTVDDVCEAVRDGADEIDLVMPYRAFLDGDSETPTNMIVAVKERLGDKRLLKVILETGVYPDQITIAAASRLAIEAGADFIKTSTGKLPTCATIEAADTMLGVIKESIVPAGLKPSGGIRTLADAKAYLDLADARMGLGWATPKTFRFGASGLHAAIIEGLGSATELNDPDGIY